MDIRESVLSVIGNAGKDGVRDSLLQKIKVFCWETGLGPVLNARPAVFGQQAVIYFPGRGGKFSFPCCDYGGTALLALTPEELQQISGILLQSPGVEIWMKDGWFAGTARLLTPDEQRETELQISDEKFFGKAGMKLGNHRQKEYRIIEVVRTAPCTGSRGPGSKAWVWPLAFCLLLLSRKKK